MDQLRDYADGRAEGICIHCGAFFEPSKFDRDHVPSKAFLCSPYPINLPAISVCRHCNNGFSLDEEYSAAFLASVVSGSTKPDPEQFPVAARTLERKPSLRLRIEHSRSAQETPRGKPEILWIPEIERIGRVIVKNARGHAFFELRQPMTSAPSQVEIIPLEHMSSQQRNEFENPRGHFGWPEVGSRLMQRMVTGECGLGGWITVQNGVYRYAVSEAYTVRIVLREYLAAMVVWDE